MNQQERVKWQKARRWGMWRFVLTYAIGMALTFLVLDAVVGSGYTLLIKQGDWATYIQQVNWKKLAWQGFFVGMAVAYFYWKRKEVAYRDDPDD
ncbi:MAG: hypothetical protein H7Z72_21555 [Bacteroidetes bacterium]|nr:hypothetical protein [Fibrella sp.]